MHPRHPSVGESLHEGITRWAGSADSTLLGLLGILGVSGSAVTWLVDWHRWPLAGLMLSVGMVGAWGLVDRRAAHPHSPLVTATERLLAIIGGLAAGAGALGILFWLLGPAPIL